MRSRFTVKHLLQLLVFTLVVSLLTTNALATVETGKSAPNFKLPTPDGTPVALEDYRGKVVVLEWFSHLCPFVKKHYRGKDMQALQSEFTEKGVVWLTVDSTNKDHPAYLSPEKMKSIGSDWNIKSTALLADTNGEVGKLYGARTTPHMYIINGEGTLVYQGAIDDNPDASANPKEATNYVRTTLNEVLEGKPVGVSETKSYGCSVKY